MNGHEELKTESKICDLKRRNSVPTRFLNVWARDKVQITFWRTLNSTIKMGIRPFLRLWATMKRATVVGKYFGTACISGGGFQQL